MRWPLNVSAEYRKSAVLSSCQVSPNSAAPGAGGPPCPAGPAGGSRYTTVCGSVIAVRPATLISWATSTKYCGPVRPCFSEIARMVEIFVVVAPSGPGEWNASSPPAHMRRDNGTGGIVTPSAGCPSAPSCDARTVSWKYSQCHTDRRGSPALNSGARSSVTASPFAGPGSSTVVLERVVPIQSCQFVSAVIATFLHRHARAGRAGSSILNEHVV